MTDKPRVVLIDLSSLFWAAWHVNNENGVQEARKFTLEGVKRCIGEGEPLVVVCCDSGKSFRKELSPEYKAQREKQPQAAYGELNKTKDRLRADGFLLWEAEGFEADDVIATACDMAVTAGHEVRVCSADKDMLALLGPHVDVLRTATWEVWNVAKFVERFKIKPVLFTDWLALKGDSSDNIPGCPGIGDVKASELIGKYDSVARLYRAIDAGDAVAKPAVLESLKTNRKAVELSRKLVELRFDVPLNFDEIYQERKPQTLSTGRDDKMADESDLGEDPKKEGATAATETADTLSSSTAPPVTGTSNAASPATELVSYVAPVAVEFERQLEPRSIRAAQYLADRLFDSRLYQRFQNADAIMAVVIRGREMGLGALTALDSFHMIEGRPAPHAYLMIARAKADPDCEYFQCIETNAESATWETKNKRNPKPTRLTYTLEQARRSGLVQAAQEKTGRDGSKYMAKANQWVVRPDEMVRKTAGVQLARMEYPAATMCLYAWEELGGDETTP